MIAMSRTPSPVDVGGRAFRADHHPPPSDDDDDGRVVLANGDVAFAPGARRLPPPPPTSAAAYSVLDDGVDGGAEEEARRLRLGYHCRPAEDEEYESFLDTSQQSPTDHVFVPAGGDGLSRNPSFRSLVSSLASESIVWRVDRQQQRQQRRKAAAAATSRRDQKKRHYIRHDDDEEEHEEEEDLDHRRSPRREESRRRRGGGKKKQQPSSSSSPRSRDLDHDDHYREGVERASVGDLARARRCFLAALSAQHGRRRRTTGVCASDVHEALADVAFKTGDVEEAVKYSFLALRALRSPPPPAASSSTGEENTRGLSSLSTAAATAKRDAKIASITLRLGDVFFDCGKLHQALKHYKKYLSSSSGEHLLLLPSAQQKSDGVVSSSLAVDTTKKMERIHKVLAASAQGEARHRMVLFHHREALGLQYLLQKDGHASSIQEGSESKEGGKASRGDLHLLEKLHVLQQNQKIHLSPGSGVFPFDSTQEEQTILTNNKAKNNNTTRSSSSSPTGASLFFEAMALLHNTNNDTSLALEQCEDRLEELKGSRQSSSRTSRNSRTASAATTSRGDQDRELAGTYLQMGFLHARSSTHERAVYYFRRGFRILRKVVNGNPARENVSDLRRTIALSYLAIGREAMAVQWYRECLRACSRDPRRMSDVLVTMGIVYGRMGQTAEAMKCFIRAVRHSATAAAKNKSSSSARGGAPDETEVITELLLPNLQDLLKSEPQSNDGGGGDSLSDRVLDARDIEVVLEFWGLALLGRSGTSHHAAACRFEMLSVLHQYHHQGSSSPEEEEHGNNGGRPRRRDDNEAAFLCSMGNILFRRGRWEEAIEFYERCLAVVRDDEKSSTPGAAGTGTGAPPELFEVYSDLGKAYLNAAEHGKSSQCCRAAVQHLQRAYDNATGQVDIKVSATPTEIQSQIHTLCNEHGVGAKGEGGYIPKIVSEGDIKSSHIKCFLICGEGRFDEAAALLHAVIQDVVHTVGRDHPDTLQLSYDLCIVYLLQGDMASARKVYEAVKSQGFDDDTRLVGLESPLKKLVLKAF